ncbi:MAG: hypothetical protein R2836_05845 [Chitinophagales bacterium]
MEKEKPYSCSNNGNYCLSVSDGSGDFETYDDCVNNCTGGGSSCIYSSYYGSQNCSSSGAVAVSSTKCCDGSYPYYCPSTNNCYSSCSSAEAAGCGSIVYGTGQTSGGGGSGGNCNYTNYSGSTNCGTGAVAVNSTTCCPSSSPYYCPSTGLCYGSCEYAQSAGCGSIVKGVNSGGGGGGGSSCTWNYTSGLQVIPTWGGDCNNPNSFSISVKNNYAFKVKVYSCVQRIDGAYSSYGDVNGINPGATGYLGFVCEGSGQYILYSEKWDTYIANNYCAAPGCN